MLNSTLNRWIPLLALAASTASVSAWQPANGPLTTPWTQEVTPSKVWPEYPRPQMVRADWVNLNGLWQYAIEAKADPQPTQWQGEILVPFAVESALSGVMKPVRPEQQLWYRRTFTPPAMDGETRLLLHFGAVDWQCTVWVNGLEVGRHTGGYDPFSFDITSALKASENELVLSVWDPTDAGYQPRGKQVLKPGGIMYTAVSGIWQTVWLEPVPTTHITSLKTVPNVDAGQVSVTVNATASARARVRAKDGTRVVGQAEGPTGQPLVITLPEAKLWSPEHPNLYDLEVTLLESEKAVDNANSYFGMRKIEVRKDSDGLNRLWLNNQVVFQYGPLDQGWWPDGLYTPPTDEGLQYDIIMTKKFGMNMARKHVKYECARWYYWCDKLGLLVWQDMPAGDSGRSDESKANFRRELKAMIDTLHNFPSIVMWVPFNEGWGQHDTPEVVGWIEHYDPTRPVNEASGWHDRGSSTVSDMHNYPGPGMRLPEENRVSVLGEFGGLGMPVHGHSWQDEQNWGYVSFDDATALTDAYVGLLTAMRPLIGAGLSAAVYTQTSDVEIEVNGLLTYDRKLVKMDLDRIALAARKLYLPPPTVKMLVPTSQTEAQTWRYTTSQPGIDWIRPAFDDSDWKSGPGGFGTASTPGAQVRTVWDSPDIWIRRSFELEGLPSTGELVLYVHHDEDAEIYINGTLVKSLKGYVGGYSPVSLNAEALQALKSGNNSVAIHCHQTQGGQYIDAGLAVIIER